jgi:predicted nucleotidyltransferase
VFKWPDLQSVHQAVRQWALNEAQGRNNVLRIGYFGSYARGNWGVGSDLDIIVIIHHSELPFEKRALEWDVLDFPVPVDIVVYTLAEWDKLAGGKSRFYQMIMDEAVWVYADPE